ncbi:MAG: helix-turn-helix domain containing protein [Lewinellaceae bacterium]|nr:helix-turn-helix domain containing protein [Lewinellaceae bacterium]
MPPASHLPDSSLAKTLNLREDDLAGKKLLMLAEGASGLGPKEAAQRYGYSEQRYHQLLKAFKAEGSQALVNKKPGPKTKPVRTEPVKNLVIRYKFLDPAQSTEAIAQKLRQEGHKISRSSVRRILAEYGLEKKIV